MIDYLIVITVATPPMIGLLMFWLALRFLWRVYKRGGSGDMSAAADSLLAARGMRQTMTTRRKNKTRKRRRRTGCR